MKRRVIAEDRGIWLKSGPLRSTLSHYTTNYSRLRFPGLRLYPMYRIVIDGIAEDFTSQGVVSSKSCSVRPVLPFTCEKTYRSRVSSVISSYMLEHDFVPAWIKIVLCYRKLQLMPSLSCISVISFMLCIHEYIYFVIMSNTMRMPNIADGCVLEGVEFLLSSQTTHDSIRTQWLRFKIFMSLYNH